MVDVQHICVAIQHVCAYAPNVSIKFWKNLTVKVELLYIIADVSVNCNSLQHPCEI